MCVCVCVGCKRRLRAGLCWWSPPAARISLYKILFHVAALVWESIILVLLPPTCKAYPIAILLHDFCAIYDPPPTPLLYAIRHTILVMTISCKGQRAKSVPRSYRRTHEEERCWVNRIRRTHMQIKYCIGGAYIIYTYI